jgi:hypothetical protein
MSPVTSHWFEFGQIKQRIYQIGQCRQILKTLSKSIWSSFLDHCGIHFNNFRYVDTSILQFLGKFQENFLLTDVNMYFDYGLIRLGEDLPRVLAKMAPLITSIDSIASPKFDIFNMVYNYWYNNNDDQEDNNKSQLLLKEMMAKTQIILTDWLCILFYCLFILISTQACLWPWIWIVGT